MKKVLVIAPYSYLPHYSGGQKLIGEFVAHLARYTDLTVISTKRNNPDLAIGYRLLRWLPNPFYRYLDIRLKTKLKKLIEGEKFDCIIWEHPYYYWLAKSIRNECGIFTMLHTHNIEYERFRSLGKWWWPILKRYEGAFFKEADQLFFISSSDMQSAMSEWELPTSKCQVLPFGIRQKSHPSDRAACQEQIRQKHHIPEEAQILLFNGLLSYLPNRQAVDDLIREVNPRLLKQTGFQYRLLICGKDLPSSYQELVNEKDRNIVFAGFVEDIETYFKAADVFVNPVRSGGGIKTKMVEAIGFGTTVVSTVTGSIGIDAKACGEKLQTSSDGDWDGFCEQIINEAKRKTSTPNAYYEVYNWDQIVQEIPRLLSNQSAR